LPTDKLVAPAHSATLAASPASVDEQVDRAVVETAVDPSGPASRSRRLWHWLRRPAVRAVLTLAVFIAAVVSLRDRLPDAGDVSATLRSAQWGWLCVAGLAQVISLAMFARQQRRLLRAFGVTMSTPRAVAVTYVRSALTASMPAGSALSAGYAFRQYRHAGANRATAAAVTALSGVITLGGLAFLYAAGAAYAVLKQPYTIWKQQPALLVGGVAGTLAIALAVVWWWRKRRTFAASGIGLDAPIEPMGADRDSGLRWWKAVIAEIPVAARNGANIRRSDWWITIAYAMANWAGDLLCLVAVALAFRLDVAWPALIGIYLGAQLVKQLPLTPGGLGLIETGLLAGLVGAGAGQAAAAAVVLVYRLLSSWLMVPLGLAAWVVIRGVWPATSAHAKPTNGT